MQVLIELRAYMRELVENQTNVAYVGNTRTKNQKAGV